MHKNTARIVGALFITATVTYMIGSGFLEPILDPPDYLDSVAANRNQVLTGMLFELVSCVAVVGIPVMLFPVLRKHNEALALGYVGFRIVESVIVLLGSISLLPLLSLSQELATVGAPDASCYPALGTLLLAARDWTILLGVNIIFPLDALILNYILFRSRLIPQWLSGWGLLGAILLLVRAACLLAVAGFDRFVLLTLPIWVQEMVFGVWLIVKGFNTAAIGSGPSIQIQTS